MNRSIRNRAVALSALAVAFTGQAQAHQAPASATAASATEAQLAQPPATGTEVRAITSTGGSHGRVVSWTAADGTRWSRGSLLLRGFKTEIDQQTRFAADGSIREIVIRGSTPSGDAAESYRVESGRMTYASPVDKGEGAAKTGAVYVPYGGMFEPSLLLAQALYKAPGRALDLAPSGRATLSPLTTLEVSAAGTRKTLTAYTVEGLDIAPQPIWFDGDKVFGSTGFLSFLPEGWAAVAPQLSKAQDEALARRAPELMAKLAPRTQRPVLFRNVRMFDADAGRFRENMDVVAAGGKIVQVRPASAGGPRLQDAQVIDGTGKTLVPGLWDSHLHYGGDMTGPLLLSTGVTSIRDPGNKPDESIARKGRIDRGELLGPRIIPVMLIDGVGPMAAQMAVNVTDVPSALAAVGKAKQMGFAGVKLYGTLDKALVAPIAAEAKRLGLRVQGHIPQGMRPMEAVRAGYDEITHINMVMMEAMPDSVIAQSNTTQRFYGPGRYGADVNLNSPEMKAYIAELKRRKVVVDPTLAVFEGGYLPEGNETAAAYLPYVGTLPPVVDRALKGGSFAETPEVSRTQMRRSFAKMLELVATLHRAGVPIVAGTDGAGPELVRDLELYVAAGLSPAEALATATIVPARVFGVDKHRGSIAVGKASDLVLVDGDPSRDVGALRQVDMVMLGDRLMKGDELRAAVGFTGRPK